MPNKTEIFLFGALALYGIFMSEMYGHEKKAFAQFRTATIAAGAAQEERTKATIEQHEKAAQEARNAYSRRIDDIRAYYGVPNGTRSGKVPAATGTASGIDGSAAYAVLVEQCAETTEQLIDLQDFINNTKE